VVLVNQVVPDVLSCFIALDEFQTKDLGLTTYRCPNVDVSQPSAVKDGVSLCWLWPANKGPRKSNESATV